ncbi:unnamed protein product [Closterium sp. NIES-53]
MALNGGESNTATAPTRPESARNAREIAGDRPNKRRAEDGEISPTGVDVLLGATEAHAAGVEAHAPGQTPAVTEEIATPNATSVSAKSEKAKTESVQRARTTKTGRGEDTRAFATPVTNNPTNSDNEEDEDGEAHAINVAFASDEQLPLLPSPNPTITAASFKNAAVREQAEVLEHLRAYLKHAEHKVRHNEPASALEFLGEAFTLITNRFKLLHVADYTNFRTANRFKLYEDKSVFTSRPFKQAVTDVAAMERAQGNFNRAPRGGGRGPMAFGNKCGPPSEGNGRSFRGSCYRCGQLGHMANACPENGVGAQGPAPVV